MQHKAGEGKLLDGDLSWRSPEGSRNYRDKEKLLKTLKVAASSPRGRWIQLSYGKAPQSTDKSELWANTKGNRNRLTPGSSLPKEIVWEKTPVKGVFASKCIESQMSVAISAHFQFLFAWNVFFILSLCSLCTFIIKVRFLKAVYIGVLLTSPAVCL